MSYKGKIKELENSLATVNSKIQSIKVDSSENSPSLKSLVDHKNGIIKQLSELRRLDYEKSNTVFLDDDN